jgi:formylglycine-generating enzyme required for sulfatase activity
MVVGENSEFEEVEIPCRWIPGGRFMMERSSDQDSRGALHPVFISHGFLMMETECTQGQWSAVMKTKPSRFDYPDLPVEGVSWIDAMRFCARLTLMHDQAMLIPKGWGWTLPTEAQWEYACRAGSTGAYAGKFDRMAWYCENSGGMPHPVRGKQPNAWGLYDMHGNVAEWCSDWFGDDPDDSMEVTDPKGPSTGWFRVMRGGSWKDGEEACSSAFRRGSLRDREGHWIDEVAYVDRVRRTRSKRDLSFKANFCGFRAVLCPQQLG